MPDTQTDFCPQVLTNSASLASLMNETSLADGWSANATSLKTVFNNTFWSEELGMYTDNATTTLTPQDANSLAVLFNLTMSTEQATSVSEGLTKNWNEFGALAPEVPDTIAPFIGGFEVSSIASMRISSHYTEYQCSFKRTSCLETANARLTYCAANGVTCFTLT